MMLVSGANGSKPFLRAFAFSALRAAWAGLMDFSLSLAMTFGWLLVERERVR